MKLDICQYDPLDERIQQLISVQPSKLKTSQGVLCTICEGLSYFKENPDVLRGSRMKLENAAFEIFKNLYRINTYKFSFSSSYNREMIMSHTIYKCFEAALKYSRHSKATFLQYKMSPETGECVGVVATNKKGTKLSYPLDVVYTSNSMESKPLDIILQDTGKLPPIQPDDTIYVSNSCFAFLTSTIMNAGATLLRRYSDKGGGTLPLDILV